jgi:hypothetical protein
MSKVLLKDGEILKTDLVNLTKPVTVWSGGLTSTSQSITIPWDNIQGIDTLNLHFQQMGNDAGNGYTGGAQLLVSNITTVLHENILPMTGLDLVSSRYIACGRYSYQHSGSNLVIKWVSKGWFDLPQMSWTSGNTMDNGLSLVRITGYKGFAFSDIYDKTEVNNKLAPLSARHRVVGMNSGNITIGAGSGLTKDVYYSGFASTPFVTITQNANGGSIQDLLYGITYKSTTQCNFYVWNNRTYSVTISFDIIVAGPSS